MARGHAAGPGAQLQRRQRAGLVDVQRRFAQQAAGGDQAAPVVVLQLAAAQALLVDAAEGGQHAQGQLVGRHFHAEYGDRLLAFDGHVLGDVHGEAGLAHAGAAGHDHQVAGVQAGGELVELGESSGQTAEAFRVLAQLLEARVDPHHQRRHLVVQAPRLVAALADAEHRLLGQVDQHRRVAAVRLVAHAGDVLAGGDEAAQHRALAHDLGIGLDVGGARGVRRQAAQVAQAPGFLQAVLLAQVLGKGDEVAGLAGRHLKLADGVEDQPVVLGVEVLLADLVGQLVPGPVVEQQAAQHRLLGFDGMGRMLGAGSELGAGLGIWLQGCCHGLNVLCLRDCVRNETSGAQAVDKQKGPLARAFS